MPSLKVIKKRITSVKNTQKITRAMKLVSAAKLRRATERAQSSRPFESELKKIVSVLFQDLSGHIELAEVRPVKRVAIVAISTDRGLCGSLNTNLNKLISKRILELGSQNVEIIALGKKVFDHYRRRGIKIHSHYTDLQRAGTSEFMAKIAKQIREEFLSGRFDLVEVYYSQFQSALVQKPTLFQLLPFVPEPGTTAGSFIHEPRAPELLSSLVPMLIDFQIYRVLLESIASEHGARMSAMESATKNAKEMIERLTLERNRARQAAITKELMEIIGGAEALHG